jgi:hypothetical protein
MKSMFLLLAAGILAAPAWGDGPNLTLLPSGDLTASPGSLTGWGFTITNDADYIEITSSQFCLDPVNFPVCTLPEEGTFTDYISQFNDIVVGHPGGTDPGTASQSFDPTFLTGVGAFAVSPSAPVSAGDIGEIVLTYDVYDADPNTSPGANRLFSDLVLSANASVTVEAVSTPEPGSFFPAAVFLGIAALRISSRKASRGK